MNQGRSAGNLMDRALAGFRIHERADGGGISR